MIKYIVYYKEKGSFDLTKDPFKVEFKSKKEAERFILVNYESNHIFVYDCIHKEWNLKYIQKIANFINIFLSKINKNQK